MRTDEKLREFLSAQIGPGKRFADRAKMARFLGLSQTTATKFFDFLNGKDTRFSTIIPWFEKLGITVLYPDEKMEGYDLVPRIDGSVGAGESHDIPSRVAGLYAFRQDFMRSIGVKPNNAEMMNVSGNSMQPVINDGDTILFDKADNLPRDGQTYVVSFGDSLMVKRLQQTPNGWLICSENSAAYPPIEVQDQELEKFKIYGRVRWIGRVL